MVQFLFPTRNRFVAIRRGLGGGGGGPVLPDLWVREHDRFGGSFVVAYAFTKEGSALRLDSPVGNLGTGFLGFAVADKEVLRDRKIEIDWEHTGYSGGVSNVFLRAGEFDRTSATHFPPGAEIPSLGSGDVILAAKNPFARVVNTYSITGAQIDAISTSGASILVKSHDAWGSEFQRLDVFSLRLLEDDGTTEVWDFDIAGRSVNMEVTGTEADYGLVE